MRVNRIFVSPVVSKTNSVRHQQKISRNNTALSFKGKPSWGGFLGSVAGTLVGIGIGALAMTVTGGVAAPILFGMAGAAGGGIGGDMLNSRNDSKSSNSGKDETDYDSEDVDKYKY